LFVTFLLFDCSVSTDPTVVQPTVTVSFPDAILGYVPLDAADNFPFRVTVDVTAPPLRGTSALTAHVWIVGYVGASVATGSAGVTDVAALNLEPTGSGHYVATTTLFAPWTGPEFNTQLQIVAEVDGAIGSGSATLTEPIIVATRPVVSQLWSGAVPRYDFCVQTSASKGFVDLIADDPSVIGTQPTGAGTLLTGPCDQPLRHGPKESHANFVVTFSPTDFAVDAVLRGKPPLVPDGPWTTPVVLTDDPNPIITLTALPSSLGPTTTGALYDISVRATFGDPTLASARDVDGLPIAFSTNVSGTPVVTGSATTDSTGVAHFQVAVAYGTQLLSLISSPGDGVTTVALGAATVDLDGSAALEATSGLPGLQFTVNASAVTADAKSPAVGVLLSFATQGSGSLAFVPSSIVTDGSGFASATVLIPFGTQTVATVSGGGALKQLVFGAPPISIAPPAPSVVIPTTALLGGATETVEIRATAGSGAMPAAGVPLTFSTTNTGATFSPTSVVTSPMGMATTQVFVPYSATAVLGAVSGGGALQTFELSALLPPLVVTLSTPVLLPGTSDQYDVTATVIARTSPTTTSPVEGLTVTFAGIGSGTSFTPSLPTNGNGQTTAVAVLPANTFFFASAVGASSSLASP
jgi:hypothetical protein